MTSEKPDFSDALRELDMDLPDSQAVRDAYARARDDSPPWLFNHVVRSWLYGAKLSQQRSLAPDAELVAVAVLLHDLGLAMAALPIAVLRLWARTSAAVSPSNMT